MSEASPAPIVLPAAVAAAPRVGDETTVAESPVGGFSALWVYLACIVVALVAIMPALQGDAFIWTDKALVRDNTFLLRPAGLALLWTGITDPATYPLPQYAPLAQTSFFIDRLIFGEHAWGYRLTTALLHATTGLMLFQLLRKLGVRGASIIAVLFVAHPLTLESVAWLTERRNVLAALLGLSSAYLALRACGAIAPPPEDAKFKPLPPEPNRLLALSAAVQLLALFASPMIAMLPGVVLLIAWWRRVRRTAPLIGTSIGLIVVGLILALANAKVERTFVPVPAAEWRRDASLAGDGVTRLQLAGRAVLTYAARLVVPYPLAIDYPRPRTPTDVAILQNRGGSALVAQGPDVGPQVAGAWIPPLLVIGLLFVAWSQRGRLGRAPLLVLGSFVLLLLPSLGFISLGWMRYSFVADRAAYLAIAPLLAGIVSGIAMLTRTRALLNAAFAVAGLALVASLGVARSVAARFADEIGFWRATLAITPRSLLAVEQLTLAELGTRQPDFLAISQRIGDAFTVHPREPSLLLVDARGMLAAGQPQAAQNQLRVAIESDPTFAPAYALAGDIYRSEADANTRAMQPRVDSQLAYRSAVQLDPRDALVRLLLVDANMTILRNIGPENPSAPALVEESLRLIDEATQLRPYDVNKLLAAARHLLALGKIADASTRLAVAQSLEPQNGEVYILLGEAYEKSGNPQQAEASYQKALDIDAKSVRALLHLAALRQSQERWDVAREALINALRIRDTAEGRARLSDVEAHRQTTWPPASGATQPATTQPTP